MTQRGAFLIHLVICSCQLVPGYNNLFLLSFLQAASTDGSPSSCSIRYVDRLIHLKIFFLICYSMHCLNVEIVPALIGFPISSTQDLMKTLWGTTLHGLKMSNSISRWSFVITAFPSTNILSPQQREKSLRPCFRFLNHSLIFFKKKNLF